MRMTIQQKIKALLNGTEALNVEQWRQKQSACAAMKSKLWNTLKYWVWDMVIWMQLLRGFKAACQIVHFKKLQAAILQLT